MHAGHACQILQHRVTGIAQLGTFDTHQPISVGRVGSLGEALFQRFNQAHTLVLGQRWRGELLG